MASQFPGMDEVIRFLQEQERTTQSQGPYSRNPVMRTTPANIPAVQAGGIFSKGAGALSALRGAGGTVARTVGGAPIVGTQLMAPLAFGAGEGLGRYYNQLMGQGDDQGYYLPPDQALARARNKQLPQTLPDLSTTSTPSTSSKQDVPFVEKPQSERIQTRSNPNTIGYIPDELQEMTVEGEVPQEQMVEEIPPEMLVEAQDTRLEDLLNKEDRPAPRAEEFPESRDTLAALGKNKVGTPPVRRETPKRGFLGHVGEFFRTGGRNRELDDYNRELDVYQKANSFTDPEKLSAGVAEKDVFSARDISARGELARYSGGGMSQQDKFMADLLGSEQKIGMAGKANAEKDAREHGYRMTEIGASAANQKLSPEAAKSQAAYKIMTEYPDIFTPEQIAAVTGVAPTEDGLSNISKGRARDDGTAKTLQTMALLQALKGGGPTPTTAKAVKEDAKKKVQVKDKSMLETKKE